MTNMKSLYFTDFGQHELFDLVPDPVCWRFPLRRSEDFIYITLAKDLEGERRLVQSPPLTHGSGSWP